MYVPRQAVQGPELAEYVTVTPPGTLYPQAFRMSPACTALGCIDVVTIGNTPVGTVQLIPSEDITIDAFASFVSFPLDPNAYQFP